MSGVNSEPSLLPYVSVTSLNQSDGRFLQPEQNLLIFLTLSTVTYLKLKFFINIIVSNVSHYAVQVKRVVVYLGRDKTMQLLEELMNELELTEPVCSAVTHMDNPPYYRITSSYKIPSVTSGIHTSDIIYLVPGYVQETHWSE